MGDPPRALRRNKGDDWFVSAVSFTGADNFKAALNEFNVNDRVVMTQVVPPLDSKLPIVRAARKALGDEFGYVSLEGYIVGKLFIAAAENIDPANDDSQHAYAERILDTTPVSTSSC